MNGYPRGYKLYNRSRDILLFYFLPPVCVHCGRGDSLLDDTVMAKMPDLEGKISSQEK